MHFGALIRKTDRAVHPSSRAWRRHFPRMQENRRPASTSMSTLVRSQRIQIHHPCSDTAAQESFMGWSMTEGKKKHPCSVRWLEDRQHGHGHEGALKIAAKCAAGTIERVVVGGRTATCWIDCCHDVWRRWAHPVGMRGPRAQRGGRTRKAGFVSPTAAAAAATPTCRQGNE